MGKICTENISGFTLNIKLLTQIVYSLYIVNFQTVSLAQTSLLIFLLVYPFAYLTSCRPLKCHMFSFKQIPHLPTHIFTSCNHPFSVMVILAFQVFRPRTVESFFSSSSPSLLLPICQQIPPLPSEYIQNLIKYSLPPLLPPRSKLLSTFTWITTAIS